MIQSGLGASASFVDSKFQSSYEQYYYFLLPTIKYSVFFGRTCGTAISELDAFWWVFVFLLCGGVRNFSTLPNLSIVKQFSKAGDS